MADGQIKGSRRVANWPQVTAHISGKLSALKELSSYSEQEITISEAINKTWLYDSCYRPIRAKTSECLACHTLMFLGL